MIPLGGGSLYGDRTPCTCHACTCPGCPRCERDPDALDLPAGPDYPPAQVDPWTDER